MKPSDFLFAIVEEDGSFAFTSKEYWEKNGVLDDCLSKLPELPSGFHNVQEALWEYINVDIEDSYKLVQEGKKLLLSARFVWSEPMNQFVNSHSF